MLYVSIMNNKKNTDFYWQARSLNTSIPLLKALSFTKSVIQAALFLFNKPLLSAYHKPDTKGSERVKPLSHVRLFAAPRTVAF